jgi:hypothetical protein
MKTALILLFSLGLVVVAIMTACRRQSWRSRRLQAAPLLRSYLAQDRDYRFFIGVPLDAPTEWKQVQSAGQTLRLGGVPVDLDSVTSFLVVYPNGEVLSAEREFFPLPAGVWFVEPVSIPKQDVLDLSILEEGKAFVRISCGRSRSRPDEPGHYSTSIHNVSDKKLRVTRFAAFTKSGAVFRLNTISGDYFSADEFISWYGAPQDGWIPPETTVTDPNNYGGGNGYWVYYFETEDGKRFAAGARNPQ